LPVLRRSEHFDFEKAKTEVKDFLSKLLVLTESEKEYVREFIYSIYYQLIINTIRSKR